MWTLGIVPIWQYQKQPVTKRAAKSRRIIEALEASMMRTFGVALLKPRFECGYANVTVHFTVLETAVDLEAVVMEKSTKERLNRTDS